uniref:Uncharacterized protein n=1 Tax=Rhizophora mucronata TaxID=61149 RepID=A0A2P2MNY4_RHIMU
MHWRCWYACHTEGLVDVKPIQVMELGFSWLYLIPSSRRSQRILGLSYHHLGNMQLACSFCPHQKIEGKKAKECSLRLPSLLVIQFLGGDQCLRITQDWATLLYRQSPWLSKCSLPLLLDQKLIWNNRCTF